MKRDPWEDGVETSRETTRTREWEEQPADGTQRDQRADEESITLPRRSLVRKLGVGAGLSALGLSGIGTAAASRTGSTTSTILRKTDTYTLVRAEVEGKTRLVKVFTAGDNAGTVQISRSSDTVTTATTGDATQQLATASSINWRDVVVRYEVFLTHLGGDRYYAGASVELTDNAATLGKITLAAVIVGLAAAIPTEGASAFLAAFAATMAAGIITNFLGNSFSFGVRDSVTLGVVYHFGVVKNAYDSSVKNTIPVTEPKLGYFHST